VAHSDDDDSLDGDLLARIADAIDGDETPDTEPAPTPVPVPIRRDSPALDVVRAALVIVALVLAFALPGCDPATLAALTPLAASGMGLAEAAVRAEAAKSGNPSADTWQKAIKAAQKADAAMMQKLADAEKKRDAVADEQRRREHAEVMAALRACPALPRAPAVLPLVDAGADGAP